MQEDWASVPAPRSRDGPGRGRRNITHHSNSRGPTATSNSPRPALNHFLSIPLGCLPAVRSAAETFSTALLAHSPGIKGLDTTIVVPPWRLHLTLGVMSLDDDERLTGENGNAKNVSSALELLRSLRSRVLATLEGHPLHVPLTAIDTMKPERNEPSRAHVLFTGSSLKRDGEKVNEYAVAVDLGTHAVSEIQICEMGSWGSEGEYICVGKIDL